MRAQVHEQAAVGVGVVERPGGAYHQGGLADTRRAVDRHHGHTLCGHRCGEQGEFPFAADQTGGVTGKVVSTGAGAARVIGCVGEALLGRGFLGLRVMGSRGAGRGRPRRTAGQQLVVPAQDCLVHAAQFLSGLHAQLVEEPAPHLLVDGQCLGLPADAVQRAHPQGGERLVVRTGQGRCRERVQGLRVAPEQHQTLRPVLVQRASLPCQPLPLRVGERPGQTRQRLAAEQVQGPAAVVERRVEVTVGFGALGTGDQFDEVFEVGPGSAGREAVAAAPTVNHRVGGPALAPFSVLRSA